MLQKLLLGLWCCEPVAHTWAEQQGRAVSYLRAHGMLGAFPAPAPGHAVPNTDGCSQLASAGLTPSLLKAHKTVSSPSSSCFLPPPLAFQHQVLNKSSRMWSHRKLANLIFFFFYSQVRKWIQLSRVSVLCFLITRFPSLSTLSLVTWHLLGPVSFSPASACPQKQ